MQQTRLLPLLLPLLVLAACTEDQPPTAPTEPGGPAFSHTPWHQVVNNLADPGSDGVCDAAECTLREAISDPASKVISFARNLAGKTITLNGENGQLSINKSLSIVGPGEGGIIVRRQSTDPEFRIFDIGESGTVTLAKLTITGGNGQGEGGGGIRNRGTLWLITTTVTGNSVRESGGGGIFNDDGTLRLITSTVSDNNSASGFGGGIRNRTGTVTLSFSTVTGNSTGEGFDGGGIWNGPIVEGELPELPPPEPALLKLAHSTVSNNSSDNVGGGISNNNSATLELTDSRVTGNTAEGTGGGIYNEGGVVTLASSTVAGNSALPSEGDGGGGIWNSGILELTKSTVSSNSATTGGGGINNRSSNGNITVTNSTVSGNSAVVGGGFNNDNTSTLTLTNSTISGNSGSEFCGGICNQGGSTLTLTNSLVALNTSPNGPDLDNAGGATVTARFSLIGDGTQADGSQSPLTNTDGNQVGSADAPIDPKLGPLANNGGPTQTHALRRRSPAINAASNSDCPSTDQRGVRRPQGPVCDIGSYERRTGGE